MINMPRYDCHVHTRFSGDNESDPAACCESAIAAGLAGLCFTDHFEGDPDSWLRGRLDLDSFLESHLVLRERYRGRLDVLIGLEVGWHAGAPVEVAALMERHPFDLLIGSVHYIGGIPVAYAPELPPIFERNPDHRTILGPYFEAVLQMICSRLFHVAGHADMIFTHACRHYAGLSWKDYASEATAIARALVRIGTVPEINTGGLQAGFPDTTPEGGFMAEYARAGGTVVTFGSDAHRPEMVGTKFAEAAAILAGHGDFRERAFPTF